MRSCVGALQLLQQVVSSVQLRASIFLSLRIQTKTAMPLPRSLLSSELRLSHASFTAAPSLPASVTRRSFVALSTPQAPLLPSRRPPPPSLRLPASAARTFATSTRMAAFTRTESDAFGEVQVPGDKYWGAQTERSLENFKINQPQDRMPPPIVRAFGVLKGAAATVNMKFGLGMA